MSIVTALRTTVLITALFGLACNGGGGGAGDTETGVGSDTGAATDPPTTGAVGDCGNDVIEGGEECDGGDLAGKQCADIDAAYVGGALACGGSCTFDASGCAVSPDKALVVLNELTSEAVAAGQFAGVPDAIELYNAGGKAADLSGWQISDDPMFAADKTYVFPGGATLAPGAFLVIVAQDPMTMAGDYPFGISDNTVETITLADGQGAMVDSVVSDGYKAKVSYCRIPDGTGAWEQCEQTFGAANQLAATACGNGKIEAQEECDGADIGGEDCEGLGLGYSGGTLGCGPKCRFATEGCMTSSQLVINELESTADDIELFNGGGASVDISGWILTDDTVDAAYDPAVDLAELVFPPGTTIAAGAYLVVQVGMNPGQHPFGLGTMGDTVTLAKADLTIIDQVTYGAGEAMVSYCRQPNGPGGAWVAHCVPTIGGAN